jgi:hypothetical protein
MMSSAVLGGVAGAAHSWQGVVGIALAFPVIVLGSWLSYRVAEWRDAHRPPAEYAVSPTPHLVEFAPEDVLPATMTRLESDPHD